MKTVMIWILSIAGTFAFIFALNVFGMMNYSFFGKWQEEIRYDIHKESQAHRDGLQRNLDALIADFNKADKVGQIGLKEAIRHQYSQTDITRLPAYQQDFLRTHVGLY